MRESINQSIVKRSLLHTVSIARVGTDAHHKYFYAVTKLVDLDTIDSTRTLQRGYFARLLCDCALFIREYLRPLRTFKLHL